MTTEAIHASLQAIERASELSLGLILLVDKFKRSGELELEQAGTELLQEMAPRFMALQEIRESKLSSVAAGGSDLLRFHELIAEINETSAQVEFVLKMASELEEA